MMRPSVPGPTGTVMPAPVFFAFMPRRRPSDESHRDRAHDAVAELLLHLESETLLDQLVGRIRIEDERVIDLRHLVARELDVHDCADALNNGSGGSGAHRIPSVLLVNSVAITTPPRRRPLSLKFLS